MFLHLIDRKTAKANGLRKYYTGELCARSHMAERRVSTYNCLECELITKTKWVEVNKDKVDQYKKDWREKNKDHYKTYRSQNAVEIKRKKAQYYQDNKEEIKEYRARNKERIAQRGKINYERKRSVKNEISRAWKQRNRHLTRMHKANRRAAKGNAIPSWYSELDEFIFNEASELCLVRKESTGFDWHVDHMIPLQAENVCGLHVWNNFQVIPARMNTGKRNKLIFTEPFEWLHHIQNYFQISKQ